MMQSRSAGVRLALASALVDAAFAKLAPVSPLATQYRVWMPLRWTIHSSEGSIIPPRSSLVTRRARTWNVHMDAAGDVTTDSRIYDDLVRAILTHPEY